MPRPAREWYGVAAVLAVVLAVSLSSCQHPVPAAHSLQPADYVNPAVSCLFRGESEFCRRPEWV